MKTTHPSPRLRLSPAAGLWFLTLGACFSSTPAERPPPGPIETAALFATADGAGREVRVSTLVRADPDRVSAWLAGLDAGDARVTFADEAEFTRVTVDEGPFPGDEEGVRRARERMLFWRDRVRALREEFQGSPRPFEGGRRFGGSHAP